MAEIQRTPVSSSTISSIGHDPKTNTLHVEFKGGDVYHYHDVPKDAHDALIGAKSVGSHLHANIKGKYSYSKQ